MILTYNRNGSFFITFISFCSHHPIPSTSFCLFSSSISPLSFIVSPPLCSQSFSQPACVAVLRPTMVSAASVCCCVLSVGAVLCHAAVSGAKALSYCLLPYGSQHQHGDKPVLMLFPDLLRHPAGTKCRNNYYPNYPGQLCLLFVCWGWRGSLWSAGGDTVEGGPTQKETTKRLVSCCLIHCILARLPL